MTLVYRALVLICLVLAGAVGTAASADSGAVRTKFPLRMSANHRYLVDAAGRPFPILGDSPQALIGDLDAGDAETYIADRKAAGFNALWVNLLCTTYTGCSSDGSTRGGIPPFLTKGDLSTPNPDYFAHADELIRLAQKAGIVVLLDPIETGGWLDVLRKNGVAKARAYGAFLGRHYRSFPNIIWFNGNDFQSWKNADDDALVLAVARGIQSADKAHIHTVELNYATSASLDDTRWRPLIQLDAAYTYGPTYAEVLAEYKRRQPLPVFMVEASYEFEQNSSSFSKGDPPILRRQEYWSLLSGSAGQLYGNHYTWQFADGWQSHLDTSGSRQFSIMAHLVSSIPWYRLVPDTRHNIVVSGYGAFATTGNPGSSNYVTVAATADRRLALAYLPDGGSITVNMPSLTAGVHASWFDPTTGKSHAARSDVGAQTGWRSFKSPGRNGDGDSDWLLVLTGA